ncbi:MAG: AGE family epimerase/isomerase, partial [Bacteroidales bacterium]|nr:AGE family epimerase/isomerase [Candidatus Liminaster caballi]
MKKLLTFVLAFSAFCIMSAQTDAERESLRNEIENDLKTNILPFWLNNAVDTVNGGFYGAIASDGKGIEKAPKSAILGARILWAFSSAYRLYGVTDYREMADMVQQYYLKHIVDHRYGGVYWTVTPDGGIDDATKQTYAAAFGIYALSEHFRATGNRESLDGAKSLFRTLETKVHDHVRGGYREVHTRDYSGTNVKGIDGRVGPSKTMNTHIHILEAYTNLYRVWPNDELKKCLAELLDILSTHLYDSTTGHLILYCDDEWKSLEHVDSYGHDIETSWLMTEAAEVMGDENVLARVRQQAVRMADAAIAEGMNGGAKGAVKMPVAGAMIYEKNEKELDRRQAWWVQSEAVVGCLNAWQITGNRKYFDQAASTWEYIKSHFIDPKDGEWWRNLDENGQHNVREPKGSMWNCPYHNSRMGYETVARLAPQTVHSEVMAWSNITGIRLEGELIDFESTLRVGTPGQNIEATGRERQQNVRYRREALTQIVDIPLHGAHFHQEVTDVDQHNVRLSWTADADTTLEAEGAFFCMSFAPKYYADAKIKASGSKVTVSAPERQLTLKFSRSVKTAIREEDGCKVLYVTLLP